MSTQDRDLELASSRGARGLCAECSQQLRVPDSRWSVVYDGYVHLDACPDHPDEPDLSPAVACPTCYLIHPGACW